MDLFLKATAFSLISIILFLVIQKQNKDFSILIVLLGCCSILLVAIQFLEPILAFTDKLKSLGSLDDSLMQVLIKAVGIGIVTEIATLICADSGNAALGKSLQILASTVIIWISIPIFNQLLELLDQILGAI